MGLHGFRHSRQTRKQKSRSLCPIFGHGVFGLKLAVAWLICFGRKNRWGFTVSGIPDRHANRNPAACAQFLARPASRGTVKSRIPSIKLSFSRFPHRILVKSRIPKIPFQTLLDVTFIVNNSRMARRKRERALVFSVKLHLIFGSMSLIPELWELKTNSLLSDTITKEMNGKQ